MPDVPPVYETLEEAAQRHRVHPRTIRRRVAEGLIPGYRAPGSSLIRLRPDEVDAALLRRIPTVGQNA